MTLDHVDLQVERVADVDVVARMELDAADRVHEPDRGDVARPPQGAQRQLAGDPVVGVVVVRSVGEDDLGCGLLDEPGHRVAVRIGVVQLEVAADPAYHARPDQAGRLDRLGVPRPGQLVGVLAAALVAVRHVGEHDLVPGAGERGHGPGAADLDVVGVSREHQYLQRFPP